MTNVRQYTDKEIIDKVKTLSGFSKIPTNYFLVGIRSNEDAFNTFDDKFYLFKGEQCHSVYKGTTNPGSTGLQKFEDYNKLGCAVLKSDTIVYDYAERGWHRGKVFAYRQVKPFPYYRDSNRNSKAEEVGQVYNDIIYANIHPASYLMGDVVEKTQINGWSLACQVFSIRQEFDEFMEITKDQNTLTYCLLKEF
jgi:hypothetical protein